MKTSKRNFKPAITLLVMSAMLLSGSLSPSGEAATGPSPKSSAQAALKLPKIPVTITFGRASRKCEGFGICKITLGKSIASVQQRAAQRRLNAELSMTAEGKLQLTLLDKAPEKGQTLFIDQDIPLSAGAAKQLGVRSATVHRGEYAFSKEKSLLNARLTR